MPNVGHIRTQSDGNALPKFFVDSNGCWIWTRGGNTAGYVQWKERGEDRGRNIHVVFWEVFNGPVPDGLEVDHLCRVRRCVNPAHMEVVTHKVNTLRGDNPTAINARKTHCKRGHKFTSENTDIQPINRGRYLARVCRKCRSARNGT